MSKKRLSKDLVLAINISRLLGRMGWSVQKPDSRAMEREEELILAWLKQDWPRIKKARQLGADILFEDEFGVSYVQPVSFTWAPKGETPVLKRVECLPAYAPELNPEEYCHGNVKRHMKNAIVHSKAEIRSRLNQGFARLRKRSAILLGFFQHAALEINQLW